MPGEHLKEELYQRLRDSRDTFDLINEELFDGVWYQNLEKPHLQWISPGFWRQLGFDPATRSHSAAEWKATIDQQDARALIAALHETAAKGSGTLIYELRFKHASGSCLWMRCRATVLADPQGRPKRMLAVLNDITALKEETRRREAMSDESKALREINQRLRAEIKQRWIAEKRFRHVFNASPSGLLLVNAKGKLLVTNRRLGEIFGYKHGDMIGMTIEELMMPGQRHGHDALRQQYSQAPTVRPMRASGELRGLRADGSSVPLEIGLSPAGEADEDGNPGDTIASVMDITERQRTERAIEQYTHDLERSNADLDDFAYAASHDLKAPLRGIQQLSGWIAEDLGDDLSGECREHITLLQNRVARLERLLDDLLGYSRVGRRHGEFRTVSPAVLICDEFELLHAPAGISLSVQTQVQEMSTLVVPLGLVIRNLLSNAIKHHDRGAGCISVTLTESAEGYSFSVSDDGPGIPANQRERIFQMFRTLKPRDDVEGSGMGLALVKKTLETYRQSIHVTDKVPRGAVFHFTWPRGDALQAKADTEHTGSHANNSASRG
ncbi:PAS domain S-box protein [Granulosicoccaceae sp. 1_MG-2023]|nr:PAS domain S-box protein [Granulosicoccaceae sp. 1_MG-2023]